MAKARAAMPDWTTFNGYANQYVNHPLTAKPGETTRFWVVAAGPTLDTNFHVVGAVFDVEIDEPGSYPFVSHAFAQVDLGQVGLLQVGTPKGTA